MNTELEILISRYHDWLKSKTTIRETGKYVEITTPYLDRHNDAIQLYVKKNGDNEYLLTDDGYTISDLESCGCVLNSVKRKALLEQALNGFNVKKDQTTDELYIEANNQTFAERKHQLLQAILAVNDLFYTMNTQNVNIFFEDVSNWILESGIRAVSGIKLTGHSGFDHAFDFIIPAYQNYPERMIQTMNNTGKSMIENLLFKWSDTKETRHGNSRLYAMLNDKISHVSNTAIEALNKYEIVPVLWSKKSDYLSELVA